MGNRLIPLKTVYDNSKILITVGNWVGNGEIDRGFFVIHGHFLLDKPPFSSRKNVCSLFSTYSGGSLRRVSLCWPSAHRYREKPIVEVSVFKSRFYLELICSNKNKT